MRRLLQGLLAVFLVVSPVWADQEKLEEGSVEGFVPKTEGFHRESDYKPDPDEELDVAISNTLRDGVISAANLIPGAGSAISTVLDFVIPEGEVQEPDYIRLITGDVSNMISQAIDQHRLDILKGKLVDLHNAIRSYQTMLKLFAEKDIGRVELEKAYDKMVIKSESFLRTAFETESGYKILPAAVTALVFHQSILKDKYLYADYFHTDSVEATKIAALETLYLSYKSRMAELMGTEERLTSVGGAVAPTSPQSFHNRFLAWRISREAPVHIVTNFHWGMFTGSKGELEDRFDGFSIQYRAGDLCESDPCFEPSINHIINRIQRTARLMVGKTLEPVFLLPRMFPTDQKQLTGRIEGYDSQVEFKGEGSYLVPDDLLTIEVGPLSQGCMYATEHDYGNQLRCRDNKEPHGGWALMERDLAKVSVMVQEREGRKFLKSFVLQDIAGNAKEATVNYKDALEVIPIIPHDSQPKKAPHRFVGMKLYSAEDLPMEFWDVFIRRGDDRNPSQMIAAELITVNQFNYLKRQLVGQSTLDRPGVFQTEVIGSKHYRLTGVTVGKNDKSGEYDGDRFRIENMSLFFSYFPDFTVTEAVRKL